MSQVLTGRFRNIIAATRETNLQDTIGAHAGEWSNGASLIDEITEQPTLDHPWRLLGWSISYNAYYGTFGGVPAARFGNLMGGFIRNSMISRGSEGEFGVFFARLILPSDRSLIATMWDGNKDPLFPNIELVPVVTQGRETGIPTTEQGPVYTFATQFPQPVVFNSGDIMNVGMWLTPTFRIAEEPILIVDKATWTLFYE